MKLTYKKLKLLLLLLTLSQVAFAQYTISGKVASARTSEALIGVNVVVKGTTNGVVTDVSGNYSIQVPTDNAVLTFSYVGFLPEEVPVNSNLGTVNVALVEDITNLDEVVVTGLASSIKRSNLANAVSTVSAEELTGTTVPQTLDAALYGKFTGANIVANSGAPGGGISMKLRGISTITGSSEPLYIVDGVYMDNSAISAGTNSVTAAGRATDVTSTQDNPSNRIADLNPEDIESIEILKGASAAAIYGARANAGVVIITTKRGKGGKTTINFAQDIGFNQILNPLGMRQYTDENVLEFFGPGELELYQRAKAEGRLIDYEKELYGNRGLITNTRINAQGGSEKTQFFISGSRQKEEGIIKNTGFGRNSIRANIDHKISNVFDFSINANYINSSANRGLTNNDNAGVSYGVALSSTPAWANLFPDERGVYPNNPYAASNPLQTRDLSTINEQTNRFIGGAALNANIFKTSKSFLKLNLRGGMDFFNSESTLHFPEILQWQISGVTATQGFYSRGNNVVFNTNSSAFLVFNTGTGDLNLNSQLGITRLDFSQERINTQATQLVGGQANLEQAAALNTFNRQLQSTDIGYVFQQEANFRDQIIATAGIRLDQSTLIGDPNKLYAFPKVSLAVNLNKFAFWNLASISQLKLRAAYGESGGIPSANSITLKQPKFTVLGSSNIGGYTGSLISNIQGDPNIRPERSREFETGIDVGVLNNVNLEVTYYNKTVDDLILFTALPPSSGYTTFETNAGALNNKGLELALSATPLNGKNISWSSRASFWLNRSKITRLDVPPFPVGGFSSALGTFMIEEGESPTQIVGLVPGEGVQKLGNAQPDFQLSWYNSVNFFKNFNFSMLWHWKQGGQNINLTQLLTDFGGTSPDYDRDDDGDGVPNGEQRAAAYSIDARPFVEDATYLKLREVGLFYNVPVSVTKNILMGSISNIRVGVSGNNLLLFTNYNSYDPEVSNFGNNGVSSGVEVTPFPSARRMMFHLAIGF
jgi:TonB-linked SusC/RagA family outer membrane protein